MSAGRIIRKMSMPWRVVTGPLRLLPDFLIIGAQRAGTTSLYYCLTENPSIAAALVKEVHFFDLNVRKGVNWYRAHFPTIYRRLYARHAQGRSLLVGEASPYYLYAAWVPERVATLLPDVKVIVLLRNPVDRAYSHYHLMVRIGKETLPFRLAIDREPDRLGEPDRSEARPNDLAHQYYSYVSRGEYSRQLERWMRVFPREHILVLKSERFLLRPSETLDRVLDFLNLPSWQPARHSLYHNAQYPAMDGAVRSRLERHFVPHNERLYGLLDRRFDWGE